MLGTTDAQLHEPGPLLKWDDANAETRFRVLTEIALAWMESVGVDRALLQPVDPAWGDYAVAHAPHKFASIPIFPLLLPPADGKEKSWPERLADYQAANPNIPAIRLSLAHPTTAQELAAGSYDQILQVCQDTDLPVFIFAPRVLSWVAAYARKYPRLTFIVDHYGIPQPPLDELDTPPWKSLPELLELAKYENVAVKICGAPSLSGSGAPFADVWPFLHQIISAFGAHRLMWASDISRFFGRIGFDFYWVEDPTAPYHGKHNYAESLALFRDTDEITQSEKDLILGGTLERLLKPNWPD